MHKPDQTLSAFIPTDDAPPAPAARPPVVQASDITEITITIPEPPKQTQPNNKPKTLMAFKRYVKRQREEGFLAAIAALSEIRRLSGRPRWKAAVIEATFHRPGARQPMDEDNLQAWLKATIDGIADAGIVEDDRGVTWRPPVQFIGKSAGFRAQVVIRVRKL
jgi:hypothetical protein